MKKSRGVAGDRAESQRRAKPETPVSRWLDTRQKVRNSLQSLRPSYRVLPSLWLLKERRKGRGRGERREECLVPGNRPNISVDIDAPRGINVGGAGIRVIPIFRDRCITTNGAPSFSFRLARQLPLPSRPPFPPISLLLTLTSLPVPRSHFFSLLLSLLSLFLPFFLFFLFVRGRF